VTGKGDLRLIEEIENYRPSNEMEERDKELILGALLREENVFSRENTLCHMTASAWITSPDRTKVLMAYHNIYDSWSWLGGHADGDTDLLRVALKEAKEESGLRTVRPLMRDIFSLEVLTVDGHMKKGKYVSSHLHLNLTYLLEGDDREMVHAKEDENRGVRWFSPEDAVAASSEPWFREHIYSKLNEKLYAYRLLKEAKR
jgi:8-oxo-dGTP pyrophosphatase MutT (NUDIX family)